MSFSFSSIPYNCLEDVFKKVGFPELCRCRRMCKSMNKIIMKKINQGLRIQVETDPKASLDSFPHDDNLDFIEVFCGYDEQVTIIYFLYEVQKYEVQLYYKRKETFITDARQLEGALLNTLIFTINDEESYEESKIHLEDFFRQAKCQFKSFHRYGDIFTVHPLILSILKIRWLRVHYLPGDTSIKVGKLQQSFKELFLCNYTEEFPFELEDIVMEFEKFHLRSSKQISMLPFIQRWVKGGKLREFKLHSKAEVDKSDPWLVTNQFYLFDQICWTLYGYLILNNRGNFLVLAGEKAIEGYIVEDVDTAVNLAMDHLAKEMGMYPMIRSKWNSVVRTILRTRYEMMNQNFSNT